jgi:peptide/nickel transport system permease protein
MRIIDIMLAFPYVLLAIALVAALGPGLINAMIAIAVVNVSFYARNIRGNVLSVRGQAYIDAARASGASE